MGKKKNLMAYADSNMSLLYDFLKSKDFPEYDYVIKRLKFINKAPLIWSNKKLTYDDAKFFCNFWPECNNGSIVLKYPVLLFLYHRYLLFRKAIK